MLRITRPSLTKFYFFFLLPFFSRVVGMRFDLDWGKFGIPVGPPGGPQPGVKTGGDGWKGSTSESGGLAGTGGIGQCDDI